MSKTMTTTELAELLGVDRRTIQRWARERRIPYLRLGARTIRFLPQHIDEIVHAYEQQTREHRPEATIPSEHYQPFVQHVPMQPPRGAA